MSRDVSFQVDTSGRTGPFIWQSVSGTGTFEIVTAPELVERIAPMLASRFSDMPDWMQSEYAEKQQQGQVVFVRILPSNLTGRRSEPV